jgi:hypothetical protein
MVRFLLVEAAQVTVRSLPEWRSRYFRLMVRRGRKTAKVAMARRLAVRLYWMWRQGWDYQPVFDGTPSRFPGCPACEPNLSTESLSSQPIFCNRQLHPHWD